MLVVTLLVYSNTFTSVFQFDDIYHIVQKPDLKSLDKFAKFSTWTHVNSRPVPMFTLALNFAMGGLGEPVYHVFNLIFHLLTGITMFYLVLLILSLPMFARERAVEYNRWFAMLMALLFLVHPLQTQAVTYVIQRITVLAALFYLLAVFLYLKGRLIHIKEGWGKQAIIYYCLTFVSFILAVLSKQIAVTIPLALLMVEFYFIRDEQDKPDKRFLIIASSVVGAMIMIGLLAVGLPRESNEYSRTTYLFTEFRVLVKYIQMLVLPINQNLDHDIIPSTGLFHGKELLSLLIIAGLIYLAVRLFNKKRLISFGIAWFFLTLSVESTIIPIRDFMFEHRAYLPSFGFFLVACYLLFSMARKYKAIPVGAIILAALIVVYGIAAYARNSVWKTDLGLWTDAVKKSPKKGRPYIWQGIAYNNIKKYSEALDCFNKGVDLLPNFPMAYFNRANVNKELGNYQEAVKDYDKAIKLNPNYAIALFNRGVAKAKMNQYTAAIEDYNASLKIQPENASAYYNRGNARRVIRDYNNALSDYDMALKMDKTNSLCYLNRGLTKAALDDNKGAIEDFDKALTIDPKNYLFYNAKGVSLFNLGKYNDAMVSYNAAIRIKPDFGQAYYNRAFLKMQGLKDRQGACEDLQIAVNYGYKSAQQMMSQICNNISPAAQQNRPPSKNPAMRPQQGQQSTSKQKQTTKPGTKK